MEKLPNKQTNKHTVTKWIPTSHQKGPPGRHLLWSLNRQWKAHIKNNPVFENIHTIAAFTRHKNFRDLLVRGRFGNNLNKSNSEDGDAEALLSALVDILQQENSTEDDLPFLSTDSG